MSDEIVAFINARLDDDERVACAATEGVGVQTGDPSSGVWSAGGSYQPGLIEDSDGGVVVYDEGAPNEAQAQHIARHDPARVLRDVEATRRILARYEDAISRQSEPDYSRSDALAQAAEYEDWVLPLLAASWSTHPDYQPEWSLT